MPTPKADETEDEFIDRCIPIVIGDGTAKDGEQAAAICHSMFRDAEDKATKAQKQNDAWLDPFVGGLTGGRGV